MVSLTSGRFAPLTVGVEEEFFVVDAGTGALVPRGRDAVTAASNELGDSVTSELNRCQVEVNSAVSTTLDALGSDLGRLRRRLAAACAPLGVAPLAAGTHPFSTWQSQGVERTVDRYAEMEQRYQILARQQVICGCHVHIGVEDAAARIEIMNRSRVWLPVILALSANSPFWQGDDSGYASYRTEVWQRWPMAGMPPFLGSPDDYDALVAELVRAGAIDDATHLYWYVRPSARYPTLEFRVCDVCADPQRTVVLAGLLRALVWTCATDPCPTPPAPRGISYQTRAAMWRAARYGVQELLVDPVTSELGAAADVIRSVVDRLGPGLDAHGDRARVVEGVERILAEGSDAAWQRQVAAVKGRRAMTLQLAERTEGKAAGKS